MHKNIHGQKVQIKRVKNLLDDDGNDVYGLYCYNEKCIYIDHSLTGEVRLYTILHECLHALFDRIGLELNPEIEELLVINVENMILDNFHLKNKMIRE